MAREKFFSDITSSEGILARYSEICKNMAFRSYNRSQLHKLIEDNTYLRSSKVRDRHISIMTGLHLLESKRISNDFIYHLDFNGKIINSINLENRPKKRFLFDKEIIVYVTELFSNHSLQFKKILELASSPYNYERNYMIIKYFEYSKNHHIWSNNIIEKGLDVWNKKKILIRSFENRFRCMEMWLEDLKLLNRNKNSLKLSEKGIELLRMINEKQTLKIEDVLQLFFENELNNIFLEDKKDYDLVKKTFINCYEKLLEPIGFVDLLALYRLVMLNLAFEYNLILSTKQKEKLLNLLWKDELITSLSNDDKGQLRYIILEV